MSRIRYTLFLLLFGIINSYGQQEAMHTQFMFNKMAYNPALAGHGDNYRITTIMRTQWINFPGAPSVQSLSASFPQMMRTGYGINFHRQSVGVHKKITYEGVYSYQFPLSNGYMSVGMAISGRHYKVDFADPYLHLTHPYISDPAISEGVYTANVFNAGLGTYFSNELFYFGFSIPRLIKADIDFGQSGITSTEVRHFYVMTGLSVPYEKMILFQPQILFKFAENSPVDFDINFGVEWNEMYLGSLTYRTGGGSGSLGESIDILLGLHATKSFFFGLAYDFTLSPIRDHENGTFEFLVQLNFDK